MEKKGKEERELFEKLKEKKEKRIKMEFDESRERRKARLIWNGVPFETEPVSSIIHGKELFHRRRVPTAEIRQLLGSWPVEIYNFQ